MSTLSHPNYTDVALNRWKSHQTSPMAQVSVTKLICNLASMCNSRGVTNCTLFFIGGVGDREDTCMIITAHMYACTIDKYKCDS